VRAQNLEIDIFDPEFFIDFGFEEKDPDLEPVATAASFAVR
jgi:hypothetical protein